MKGRRSRPSMTAAMCSSFNGSATRQDTYTGGVDVKLAKRTTLSYDQFYVFYKGDTSLRTGAHAFQAFGWNAGLAGSRYAGRTNVKCGTSGTSNNTLESGQRHRQSVLQRNHHAERSGADADNVPDRTVALCFALLGPRLDERARDLQRRHQRCQQLQRDLHRAQFTHGYTAEAITTGACPTASWPTRSGST